MVSFRKMTVDDAALLATIGGESLVESHGRSASAEVMQAYRETHFSLQACQAELAEEAHIFTAVYYNGEAAGYSKIICQTPHPAVLLEPVTKLERLYLLKEFYGLTLGHQLLHHAIAASKAQGDKGMWLDVWKGNERAVEFYRKQGFATVGESKFVLTATHANPIWVMLLRY